MHISIPVLGLLMMALIALVLACWCFLCFRLGLWLVGGCSTQRYSHHVAWCGSRRAGAVNMSPAPSRPEPRGKGCSSRRKDKPSSVVGMILILLLISLAIFGLRNRRMQHAFAPRHPAEVASVRADDDKNPSWTIIGWGKTEKDAEQVAMEDAYGKVLNYVDRELPGPKWVPSQDYIARRLVKSKQNEEPRAFPDLGLSQKVTVKVALNLEDQKDLLRRGRLLLLVKLLGAAVLLLGAIATYIRIDESSKGYYTGWLRVAAVVVVAAIILGLIQAGVFI